MSDAANPIPADDIALMAIVKALADPSDEDKPITRRTLKRARRILQVLCKLGWRSPSAPTSTERELKAVRLVQNHSPQIAPHFPRDQWFSLPMRLRSAWWDETNYGDHPPSDELMAEIRAKLEGKGHGK